MENVIKIVKSLENFGLLINGVSETIQNESKKQKSGFLGILLETLGASLLEYMLSGKGVNKAEYCNKGDGIMRADYSIKMDF